MVSGIAIFNGKLEKVESVWVDEKSLHCIRDDMGINCNETAESQKRLTDARKAIYEYEMCSMKREREIILKSHGR